MANFIVMKKWGNLLAKSMMLVVLLTAYSCDKKTPTNTSQPAPKPTKTYTKAGITVYSYDYNAFKSFLEKDNDTTYVVNFWATWCAPCVAELPNFEKLGSEYKSQKVKVLLVSLDFQKQVEKSLLPFIKKRDLHSKVVLLSDPDANNWISKVDSSWSGAIPATIIYNNKKKLRKFYEKSFSYGELQDEIKPFIK